MPELVLRSRLDLYTGYAMSAKLRQRGTVRDMMSPISSDCFTKMLWTCDSDCHEEFPPD